jgi:NADPH-dependent F420 reductase
MWAMIRSSLAAAAIAAGGGLVASHAAAETVALIGTGNVGAALGQRLAQHGHRIVYGSRDPAASDVRALVAATGHGALVVSPADAAARSDIIVLAVPWSAVEEVVRGLGELDGKIVVDPTNPRVMAGDGFADYPIEDSNAERIARLAPGAQIVKAFNTLGSETMLDPKVADSPVTIPIVGDDRDAKARVAALAREIGFDAVDVGPLRHARIVEGLHFLRANALGGRINYHFPRDPARD